MGLNPANQVTKARKVNLYKPLQHVQIISPDSSRYNLNKYQSRLKAIAHRLTKGQCDGGHRVVQKPLCMAHTTATLLITTTPS